MTEMKYDENTEWMAWHASHGDSQLDEKCKQTLHEFYKCNSEFKRRRTYMSSNINIDPDVNDDSAINYAANNTWKIQHQQPRPLVLYRIPKLYSMKVFRIFGFRQSKAKTQKMNNRKGRNIATCSGLYSSPCKSLYSSPFRSLYLSRLKSLYMSTYRGLYTSQFRSIYHSPFTDQYTSPFKCLYPSSCMERYPSPPRSIYSSRPSGSPYKRSLSLRSRLQLFGKSISYLLVILFSSKNRNKGKHKRPR